MGWAFDFGLMASYDFQNDADNLILYVFDTATTALDNQWKKEEEGYKKAIAEAYKVDESEGQIVSQERDWLEELFWQRRQGVGVLALDWLMSSLQQALHSAKHYLDATHPPQGPYKKNKRGWLGSVTGEYMQRFQLDLTKSPVSFERIQELVLARDAGIHRDEGMLEEYLKKIAKPAFVDHVDYKDRLFVTRENLVLLIQECKRFIEWVEAEVEKLRTQRE